MIVEDYTIDKKFSELVSGECFVMYSEYYMKINIVYYDVYSSENAERLNYAVNLKTGIAAQVKEDTKVRVVSGKLIIE